MATDTTPKHIDAAIIGGPHGFSAIEWAKQKAAEAQGRLDALAAANQPFVPRYRKVADPATDRQRALDAAMDADWQSMTLDTFRGYTSELREAAARVAGFVEEPRGFLYLWGDVGTGKTHLAAGAAVRLVERGYQVRVYRAADVATRLRSAAGEGAGALDTLMGRLKNTRLLVLDDFGAEHTTDFLASTWLDLLDYRYRQYAATILTANVAPEHMGIPRLASRLLDAARAAVVGIAARDYRTFTRPPDTQVTAADFAPPAIIAAACDACGGSGIVKRDLSVGHQHFGRAFPCPVCRGGDDPLRNGGER